MIEVFAHVSCKNVVDDISANLLYFDDGEVFEDISALISDYFKGIRDVMLLKYARIVVPNRKFRHRVHFESIGTSAVRYIVAQSTKH